MRRIFKSFLYIMLLFIPVVLSSAQEIKVKSIEVLQNDLTARTKPRQDLNGDNCALLKVVIPLNDLVFNGSKIRDVEHSAGIYYVYVPAGTKRLEVQHNQYYPAFITFSDFDIKIEKNVTYRVTLERTNPPGEPEPEYQFVSFEVSPTNASIEFDGEMLAVTDGTAQKLVEVGSSHHYKVSAPGMITQEGDVFVESATDKTVCSVDLKSNAAPVSVKLPVKVEIWINGEIKSTTGSWEGTLSADSYKFEAKLDGKVLGTTVVQIKQSDETQEISIKIDYATLILTSNTPSVFVEIDGEYVGNTPLILKELLPGVHKLKAYKDGFTSVDTNIEVVEKQSKELNIELEDMNKKAALEKSQREAQAQAQKEAKEREAREKAERQAREKAERASRQAAKKEKPAKAKSSGSFVVGADLGIQSLKTFSKIDMAYGAIAGYAGKIGGYGRFNSNLGMSFTSSGADVKVNRTTVAGGALFNLAELLYLYGGLGFSSRTLTESKGSEVFLTLPSRNIGIDAGAIMRFNFIGISAGAFIPVNVKASEIHVGVLFFF